MPEKKTTKPGVRPVNEDFTWEKFVKDCANNKYVLVVGPDAVLNKSQNTEADGNSMSLLFHLTKDYLNEHENVLDNASENFSQLSRKFLNIHNRVLDTIEDLDFESSFDDEIEPSLIELLNTKCFRMVLTTTVDPYVEIAMEKVWGKGGFRILNIYGNEKDLSRNELTMNEFDEIRPTLYYVFGKADVTNRRQKFVLSENDAMSVIRKWFASEPADLLKYIQGEDMKIVSVGCRYDNWLFRFFWYILRGDVRNLSSGQVAVELDDKKLLRYLRDENVKHFPDARSFMQEAAKRIYDAIKISNLPRKGDGIFISYASEDRYIALPLFSKLTEMGYSVWLDEEKLEPSNEYRKRIIKAINSCRIFMPILSSQVMYDLLEDNNRYYRDSEWKIAQSRYENENFIGDNSKRNIKVLSVVVGHYNVRNSYHQKTEECIVKATAFEAAKESFDTLVQLINKLLN